jgi:chromosome segregation protein
MRIKQLELIGFKSFPTRTVLEFPPGVTGVVGPNGCGKSNIVDAMRWVLGEQSAKHLRGDSMEAVVFNGNDRQAPLGMAEVSIIFENDGRRHVRSDLDQEVSDLPEQFRDLAEIMITRRYFRSGESEYFINKTPCRLKDITELFLGTGVGSKAYAIIEQGRVEQLIHAKPEDRRLFIEEAAGTTLYRSRKLAAQRKMDRTRENLARVSDILSEIDRQRRYIERQAKKAETHRRLSDEVRGLELRVTARQAGLLKVELAELDARKGELADAEAEARSALVEGEQRRQRCSSLLAEAEQTQAAVRESIAVLEAERNSVRERAALLRQEREERERRRTRLEEDLRQTLIAENDTTARLAEAQREGEKYASELLDSEGNLSGRQADFEEAQRCAAGAQQAAEDEKSELVSHIARVAESRNATLGHERRSDELQRQLGVRREEEAELDQRATTLREQLEARRAVLAELRRKLADTTAEQERQGEQLRSCAEARRHTERAVAECETSLMQARSRLESLEQIQQTYEGFGRGVRSIMQPAQRSEGVLGVVADVIDIPQEYERAAAAVLGERLQYVIVSGEEEGAGAVDRLRQCDSGRGSFIPLHPRQYEHGAEKLNGASKRMLDVVQFDDSYRSVAEALLGDAVLVPDLRAAVAVWRQNGVRVTLVTPEGDVMHPSGVITGGSDHPVEEEILARRREIESLRAQAVAHSSRLDELQAKVRDAVAAVNVAESAVRTAGEHLHALTVEIVAAEKDIERVEQAIPECDSRRGVVRFEIEGLVEEAEQQRREGAELEARLSAAQGEQQALERRAGAAQARRQELATQADSLRAAVTALQVRVAESRQRQQGTLAAIEGLRARREELGQRQRNIAAEIEASARERDDLDGEIEAAGERQREQDSRRLELEGELALGTGAIESRRAELAREESQVRQVSGRLEEIRGGAQDVDLARSEHRLRLEHLAEGVREKYECDLPEPAAETEGADPEAEAEQLQRLKERLARLGDINPAAIEELRELEERGSFLAAQRDDLERSLTDLERTIQKLNRASRTRFAETFARANETFQQVFPRLFRGGEGRLVLTDENNLLETGVDIVVRPPGKRLDTVSLLSGGEKALVAVSLIFSLFLINPTPFCILDEVDAPLDDANIGRYSQMIREMSEHSQFILITHNKRTMEAAGVLYGITMQEPGISKVISVAMS